MGTTTIPKQHYVTIQYRADVADQDGLLGFASPYTKDAAFEKRKSTQDSWAYNGRVTVNIDPEDDSVSCEGRNYKEYRAGNHNDVMFDVAALFMTRCFPIIINNVPTEGFEISRSVRRCGWGGGGNVVWRLADPRGFELEISSDNFARIIDCATIEKGVILGKCVWGRDGAKNILLPEASDVYQDAVKRTAQVNTKISLKDVQIGDTVELLSKDGTDSDGVYLGKYYFLCVTEGTTEDNRGSYNRHYENGIHSLAGGQAERYLFEKDGSYFTLSTLKIVAITNKIATPLLKEEVAQEVTGWLSNTNRIDGFDYLVLISPTKVKPEKVTTVLEPVQHTGPWVPANKYDSIPDALICKNGDRYYIASFTNKPGSMSYPRENLSTMAEIKLDLANNKFSECRTVVRGNGSYYSRDQYSGIVETDPAVIEATEKFRLVVTANGITGKVYRAGYF